MIGSYLHHESTTYLEVRQATDLVDIVQRTVHIIQRFIDVINQI
jgi:hypothetical protein